MGQVIANINTSRLVHSIRWGDAPAWISCVVTAGVLTLALWQYFINSRRRVKRQHSHQAENISAWVVSNNGREAWMAIQNQSKNPIYEVILTLVPFQGSGDPTGKNVPMDFRSFLSTVPPGLSYTRTAGNSGMSFHPSVNIVFTDNLENNWVRDGDGKLHEIDEKPMEYYGISRPVGWGYAQPEQPKAGIEKYS